MASNPSTLLQLPNEILTAIAVDLPNRDIKSLRLTCRALSAKSQLRWNRVFLSANLRNIQVFRAIADHDQIRQHIVEIVWDDARLDDEPPPMRSAHPASPHFDPDFDPEFDDNHADDDEYDDQYDDSDDDDDDDVEVPRWFAKACMQNLQFIKSHKNLDAHQPDQVALKKLVAPISLERSWEHYERLLRQQKEILTTNLDAEAFEYGLQRFPALQRVTITPAAHGWLLRPLYETPMIRAFPPSFNYPIPCSWPVMKQVQRLWENSSDVDKNTWRAFRLVTRTLAARRLQRQAPTVTEIVIDVNQVLTGLNAHIFDEDCREQRDLVSILQSPNFRRLDLALAVGGQEHYGWRAFHSGCLRRTLAAAPALEHASLTTDMIDMPDPYYNGLPSGDHHFVPLRNIFPVETWTRLRHFKLSHFAVRQNDLLSLLQVLPPTLRSVELSFLFFLEGNHRDLVADMRDQLGWRQRPVEQRPRLAIGLVHGMETPRRGIWVDRLVERFMYHDEPNPFGSGGWGVNQIPYGCGGTVKDAFDPAYERPWVDFKKLQRLGFIKT